MSDITTNGSQDEDRKRFEKLMAGMPPEVFDRLKPEHRQITEQQAEQGMRNLLNELRSTFPVTYRTNDAKQNEINDQFAKRIDEFQDQLDGLAELMADNARQINMVQTWLEPRMALLPTEHEVMQSLRPTKSDNRGRRVIVKIHQWLKSLVGGR